jgi:hypothetical protein
MRETLLKIGAGASCLMLGLTAVHSPAHAATLGTAPTKTINLGTGGGLSESLLANDGTTFLPTGSEVDVLPPNATSADDISSTITGVNYTGEMSYSQTHGMAFVTTSAASTSLPGVEVFDPFQTAGAVNITRTISGALTQIDSPESVSWAPDGSLWVLDSEVGSTDQLELLHFPAGASGNVSPDADITGPATGLDTSSTLDAGSLIAALPNGEVAALPLGFDGQVSIFSDHQSGNAAPKRFVNDPQGGPDYLFIGLAADASGRLYVTQGDYNANDWGHIDVFAPGAGPTSKPEVTVTGATSKLHVPALPSVAANGKIVLADIIIIPSQTQEYIRLMYFNALPSPASTPGSVKAASKGSKVTVSWKKPSSTGGAAISAYTVTISKGSKKVTSLTTTKTSATFASSKLPSGTLTASVTATNVAGASPAGTKTFKN